MATQSFKYYVTPKGRKVSMVKLYWTHWPKYEVMKYLRGYISAGRTRKQILKNVSPSRIRVLNSMIQDGWVVRRVKKA